MKQISAFLLFALAIGCGRSDKPQADASKQNSGKPSTDDARLCVSDYMYQCGWKEVEFISFADQADIPAEAKTNGDAWAFQFSAKYKNLFGEAQETKNWVAVVNRADGKVKVLSCFDETKHLIGGHGGQEESEKAKLTMPPTDAVGKMDPAPSAPAAIIAPKP